MHLLITGGAGFIGRALQEFLHARYSYKLYAPSSSELDLRDCHAVSSYIKAHKISHIIHLANRGGGRDTMGLTDLAEYNLRMFFAIMSQADRVEKILHFGSGAEYSKHKPIVSASEPSYLESLPLDSYGFYKGVCSRFIESTRGNVICLRIFGCYGAGENYRYKFISNAIVKNLLHLPITIYKDCIFDYIYVDDLCAIIEHFLHASISSLDHRVYNASSGSGILLSELAKLINAASPYKSPIHFIESGLNNQYTSDNSRLLQAMPSLKLTPHSHAIESMREYFASNLTSLDVESIKADPYLSKIGEMWAAADNGGGGGKYLRDSAWLVDSASGSHCTDFTNFLKKHRLAASGIPCFERTADLKSSSLSKFVKNSTSNTAIPRILEEEKQASLRDTAPAVAWQSNSAQAESNQINGARKACNLERTLSQAKLESSHTAQKVESSFKKADSMDCCDLPSKSRNDRKPILRTLESKRYKLHTSTYSLHTFLESTFEKTQMDCHAIATALTRNDSNNAPTLKTPAKDSRIFAHNAQSAFDTKASGGRIC